jgi:hypothetical protein
LIIDIIIIDASYYIIDIIDDIIIIDIDIIDYTLPHYFDYCHYAIDITPLMLTLIR